MSTEQLATALHGLQTDGAHREQFNQWLQEFQRSSAAWQVAHDVLSAGSTDKPLKIFCAQTLRHKIARDLHQVPREMRIHLKNQVLSLLDLNKDLLTVVGVQLCVALAAFAMQVPEWDHPVHELIAYFNSETATPLIFEFLRVLPEEFDTSRPTLVDPQVRDIRAKELIEDNARLVLNFMMERAQFVGHQPSLFFESLNPWLCEVSLDHLIDSPLIDALFQYLDDEDARESASDCICTVIHETDEVREQLVKNAIQKLFPQVIALPSRFAARYSDDPEIHRDITKILSRAGEDWHVAVCSDPVSFLPLVEAIAQCVFVPDANTEVIEYTFEFFERVKLLVSLKSTDAYASAGPLFKPLFLRLISAFTGFLEYPQSFASSEAADKFRDFRYIIGDVLKACCVVVGHEEALKLCAANLKQLLTDIQANKGVYRWQPIEAILFCIRLMARVVPLDNTEMPAIFELLPLIPKDADQIQHAAVMLIGRYSDWTATRPKYIPFSLRYIVESIQSSYPETKRGGSHAFLYFCQDCASKLVEYLPELIEFYAVLSGSNAIDRESYCKISDGIGSVLTYVDKKTVRPYLDALFAQPFSRADGYLKTDNDELMQRALADTFHGLASLVAIVKCDGTVNDDHPLIDTIYSHHATGLRLLTDRSNHPELVEAVCQYYVQVFYNCGRALAVKLGCSGLALFLETLTSVLVQYPGYESIYKLSSAIVRDINPSEYEMPDQNYYSGVLSFSEAVSKILFTTVPQLTGGGEHLAVLICGINHLNATLVGYTDSFAHSDLLESSVSLVTHVLAEHDDIEVLEAAAFFLIDLGTYCLESEPTAVTERLVASFDRHGQQLFHGLILWYLWRFDPDFNSLAETVINTICRVSPAPVLDWLNYTLASLPAGSLSDEEKFEFTGRFFQAMANQRFETLGRLINEFAGAWSERNSAPR